MKPLISFTGFSFIAILIISILNESGGSSTCESKQLRSTRSNFTIAGECTGNTSLWFSLYRHILEEHLNLAVGLNFSPTINFTLRALNTTEISEQVLARTVDFVLLSPITYVCLDTEVGLTPLATLAYNVSILGQQYALTKQGGAVIARADNPAVQSVGDLRGKIIEGPPFSDMLPYWSLFEENGLSFINDPAQVPASTAVRLRPVQPPPC